VPEAVAVPPRAGGKNAVVTDQTCSLYVRLMGGVAMREKRGRGGPPWERRPHRHGPDGTSRPPPGPSSHRQLCVAGLKGRSARGSVNKGEGKS